MAIRTKDELMEILRARIGDDQSDGAISLVEDISDTYDDMQSKANGDGTDWKSKYEENDAQWRQRYRDRFFNSEKTNDTIDNPDDREDKPLTYEDLFKEE